MTLGGDGLARHQGLVYFVPLAAPGDRVAVEIFEKKKNFARAKIVSFIEKSNLRVDPPCPYYGDCGGCNWQHLQYEEQLRQKEGIVRENLEKIGVPFELKKIIPSEKQFFYRNRISVKSEAEKLGFYSRKSHDIVDVQKCMISEESVNAELSALRKKALKAAPSSYLIHYNEQGKVVSHPADIEAESLGFSQVNTAQNERLIKETLALSEGRYDTILDLYAGSGNFTFPLMEQHRSALVVGVEFSQKSVALAQKRIQSLNLSPKKIQFFRADVQHFLKRALPQGKTLILLDPPRTGCEESAIKSIAEMKPSKMIYISCNPATLSRDLSRLKAFSKSSFSLRAQPFDMFPQTDHIETLVEVNIDSLS